MFSFIFCLLLHFLFYFVPSSTFVCLTSCFCLVSRYFHSPSVVSYPISHFSTDSPGCSLPIHEIVTFTFTFTLSELSSHTSFPAIIVLEFPPVYDHSLFGLLDFCLTPCKFAAANKLVLSLTSVYPCDPCAWVHFLGSGHHTVVKQQAWGRCWWRLVWKTLRPAVLPWPCPLLSSQVKSEGLVQIPLAHVFRFTRICITLQNSKTLRLSNEPKQFKLMTWWHKSLILWNWPGDGCVYTEEISINHVNVQCLIIALLSYSSSILPFLRVSF